MKIIKNKEKDGKYFLYSFDLNQCYRSNNCPPGRIILYTLAKSDEIPVERILIDYWGDIHSGITRDTYSPKLFKMQYPSFESFYNETMETDAGPWMIRLTDGTMISGENGTIINVQAESDVTNFTKLLMRVENATYELQEYPAVVIDYLCNIEGMSLKSSVQAAARLSSYPELYREFCGCLQTGKFIAADNPIRIEGYTAEQLIKELGLHPVGAYKTLADLWDDQSGTLELIKKGIARK